ncbi:MAG: hypothetical protein ACREEP_13150, partial [Dongiaceae bacterium]
MITSVITRRRLMLGTAGVALAGVLPPSLARGQSKSILRYRVFTDMQVLDPPFRLTAPEGDVITVIFPKLVSF